MSSDPGAGDGEGERSSTDLFGKLDSLIQKHQGRSSRSRPKACRC
jgi:hypothetical protein